MSDEVSARLKLPLLAAGQAQKELTVNEAVARLDLIVQASVVAAAVDVPPDAPAPGLAWIIGDTPTGAWTGWNGALAGWTDDGWRFVSPVEGLTVWVQSAGLYWRYSDGAWQAGAVVGARVVVGGTQVVGARAGAIATPSGGDMIDAEARDAVAAILAALREHGLIEA
jgi:hypothetical protein